MDSAKRLRQEPAAPSTLTGLGVSPGIGYGPAHVMAAVVPTPREGARHDGDARAERERAERALGQVAADLEELGVLAGGEAARMLDAQAMMARDPVLADEIGELIDHGVAAPRAVFEAFGRYRRLLTAAGGYLGERVADLDDVRDRVIALITGRSTPAAPTSGPPCVLVAGNLAPADTALLSRGAVAAFVTEQGGPTGHIAILARLLGVPAVVGCAGATAIAHGTPVLVDGASGRIRLNPSAREVARVRRGQEAGRIPSAAAGSPAIARRPRAVPAVTTPRAEARAARGRTADGHAVPLLANIGGPRDVDAALTHGAEGVGLYRTEFLFLGRQTAPSAEEQEHAYRAVLQKFPGRRVVIRTLDAGSDKPLVFLPAAGSEPNPALGERGLRRLRGHPELMTEQLTAVARAAAATSAQVQIMAPMVATVAEAAWFAEVCRTVGSLCPGIMIEVPSAALRAADLIQVVDFFSIGTNDLAQYALAADRQAGSLAGLQDPWHPAVLDLVAMAASAASRAGKDCGVCGEAAADPLLACVLVGLGVTSLSMAAPALPLVRMALARHTLGQCRAAASAARAAISADAARAAAHAELPAVKVLGFPQAGGSAIRR